MYIYTDVLCIVGSVLEESGSRRFVNGRSDAGRSARQMAGGRIGGASMGKRHIPETVVTGNVI